MKQLEFGWTPFGKLHVLDAASSLNINNFKSSENGYYEFTIIPLICGLKRNTMYGAGLPIEYGVSPFLAVAVDGQWGCWSEWSPCGASFKRRRTRACNNPSPMNGGKPCEGQWEEEEDCYISVFTDR